MTGGSAGIERAAALAFAANGARVAVMGRRKERLDAVVEHLPAGLAVVGDLGVAEDCKRAVVETITAFGGLDILVNNGVLPSLHLPPAVSIVSFLCFRPQNQGRFLPLPFSHIYRHMSLSMCLRTHTCACISSVVRTFLHTHLQVRARHICSIRRVLLMVWAISDVIERCLNRNYALHAPDCTMVSYFVVAAVWYSGDGGSLPICA